MPGISELARMEEENGQLQLDLNDNPLTAAVREFRETFDASQDPELWLKLIREEESEVAEAFANLLKEVADLDYVMEGFVQVGGNLDDLGNMRLTPLVLAFVQLLPPPVRLEALNRVHASNMSKLGEDGKPLRREDGKVLKGPNYQPADLSDLTIFKEK